VLTSYQAEVTHGRVAMLATVGWLVQEKWAPLFGAEIGGPALRHFQEVQAVWPSFWIFVTIAIATAESNRGAYESSIPNTAAAEARLHSGSGLERAPHRRPPSRSHQGQLLSCAGALVDKPRSLHPAAGALGFDPLGLAPREERELKIMATKELNNGRLAMIAIGALAWDAGSRITQLALTPCLPQRASPGRRR